MLPDDDDDDYDDTTVDFKAYLSFVWEVFYYRNFYSATFAYYLFQFRKIQNPKPKAWNIHAYIHLTTSQGNVSCGLTLKRPTAALLVQINSKAEQGRRRRR